MTRNKSFCYLLLFLFSTFFSCTEGKKEKVKDFREIVPKAQSTKNSKQDESMVGIDSAKINYYSFLKLKIDSVIEFDRNLVPDRFNPIRKKKETIYSNGDSIQFFHWNYKDSTHTKRAFFNLLDCFESPCKPIKLFEKKNVSKLNFVILEEMKNLVILKSNKPINLDEWIDFLMKKKTLTKLDFIISQRGKNSVQWFEIQNAKLKERKK